MNKNTNWTSNQVPYLLVTSEGHSVLCSVESLRASRHSITCLVYWCRSDRSYTLGISILITDNFLGGIAEDALLLDQILKKHSSTTPHYFPTIPRQILTDEYSSTHRNCYACRLRLWWHEAVGELPTSLPVSVSYSHLFRVLTRQYVRGPCSHASVCDHCEYLLVFLFSSSLIYTHTVLRSTRNILIADHPSSVLTRKQLQATE